MKFGYLEPSKIMFDFWNVLLVERRLTQFVRVPPYEISVVLTNFIFFRWNAMISWGKKHTALFQTHNWEKSSFFSTLVLVFATVYANTWQFDTRHVNQKPKLILNSMILTMSGFSGSSSAVGRHLSARNFWNTLICLSFGNAGMIGFRGYVRTPCQQQQPTRT